MSRQTLVSIKYLIAKLYPTVLIIVYVTIRYKETIIKKIQLRTNDKFPLYCNWKIKNEKNNQNRVVIEPSEFTLEPLETFICEVTINPETYEDIHETFTYNKYKHVNFFLLKDNF